MNVHCIKELFIFFLLLFVKTESKRSRKGKGDPKSSLKKCNLRTEYWEKDAKPTIVAVANMRRQIDTMNVNGTVYFEQHSYRKPMRIRGKILGLDPSGKHGLFITSWGLRGCNWQSRRSGHYNPFNVSHGDARSCWRHVGDLEQLQANEQGGANFSQFDARVQLQGMTSIIGRQLVILFKSEDNPDMTSTRIACGIIGYARGSKWKITKFKTPRPENGWSYFYGATAVAIATLVFLWKFKQDYQHKMKNRPVFESLAIKERHHKVVERHRRRLR